MSIHTVAPVKPEYIRVVDAEPKYIGRVGQVIAEGDHGNMTLIFVKLVGESAESVFNKVNIEYITKKEYFIGALGG